MHTNVMVSRNSQTVLLHQNRSVTPIHINFHHKTETSLLNKTSGCAPLCDLHNIISPKTPGTRSASDPVPTSDSVNIHAEMGIN